jgi:hypothetical protein
LKSKPPPQEVLSASAMAPVRTKSRNSFVCFIVAHTGQGLCLEELGKKWHQLLSAHQKTPYERLAQQDKERFERERQGNADLEMANDNETRTQEQQTTSPASLMEEPEPLEENEFGHQTVQEPGEPNLQNEENEEEMAEDDETRTQERQTSPDSVGEIKKSWWFFKWF